MKKSITFVTPNKVNQDSIKQIAVLAKQRGFDIKITEEAGTDVEIGIYTHHRHCVNETNEKLSIIMFHGVDQAYKSHFWPKKGWGKFDIGLVTGDFLASNYEERAVIPEYNPKIGVFNVGWPKSDFIYTEEFQNEVEEIKNNLDITDGRTIIYAPTSEDHGKIDDFVSMASDQADNLLIKYAPYEVGEYIHEGSIEDVYRKYKNKRNIHFIDKNKNIFVCLSMADVLVSEESSVLQESILTNTVPISVIDWPIRDDPNPNFTQIPEFAIKTEIKRLDSVLSEVLSHKNDYERNIKSIKHQHFSNLGNSSKIVIDLIESFVDSNTDLPVEPLQPNSNKPLYTRHKLTEMIPKQIKDNLQGTTFDNILKNIDSKLR